MSGELYSVANLREASARMKDMCNKFDIVSDNILWTTSLPLEEQFMLDDVKKEFMKKTLNSDLDYSLIVNKYRSLKDFYSRKDVIKRGLDEFGFNPLNSEKYDFNLTLEEAVPYYMGYTVQEVEEFCRNFESSENLFQNYLVELRGKYKGDLGSLVGKNIEDYRERATSYKQGVEAFADCVKSHMSTDTMQVAMNNFYKTFNSYVDKIKQNTGVQNIDDNQVNENDELNSLSR